MENNLIKNRYLQIKDKYVEGDAIVFFKRISSTSSTPLQKPAYLILFMLFIVFFPLSMAALADESPGVAIFPFGVHAPSSMEYLGDSVPVMVGDTLSQDGARIMGMDDPLFAGEGRMLQDMKSLQSMGVRMGVDYILWGTLFTSGGEISIDISLFNVVTAAYPIHFYGRARAVENLFSSIKSLCREISSEIFNRQLITDISVAGNRRIESDAVLRVVGVKPGDIFNPVALSREIRNIFGMGNTIFSGHLPDAAWKGYVLHGCKAPKKMV
ncbi:MAG: hypothetical protein HQK66_05690, partial [Desulfamplus sp.]|nr:hypothetical protein [Desulfamplus sp.]